MMTFTVVACRTLVVAAATAYGIASAATRNDDLGRQSAGRTSPRLEEIIVTARRLAEPLQTIPIATTALTAGQLDRQQLDDVESTQRAAPSLYIAPVQSNRMMTTVSMRGHVEPDLVPTVDPAVGLFLDGVFIARATGANLRLVDMQRVEILRGPQGTLFGRDTVGGAINLVPAKPTDALEGLVKVRVGDYSLRELTGVINLPVAGPVAALRIAGLHSEHDGYGRSMLVDRDLNDDDTDFLRAQLRLQPSGRLMIDFAYDMTWVDTSTQLISLAAAFPPATDIPAAAGHPEDSLDAYVDPTATETWANRAGSFDARVGGVSAVIELQLDRFALKSISAYRDLDMDIHDTDQDGTPYDIAWQLRQAQRQHQFSQELQVFGQALDTRLDWLLGAYYFTESAALAGQQIGLVPIVPPVVGLLLGEANNDSSAVYGHATYRLSARWRIGGGARYVEDRRRVVSGSLAQVGEVEICAIDPGILDQPDVCRSTSPTRTFDYAPFTIGVDYLLNDQSLLYAKFSRGHRAGGYNFRVSTAVDLQTFGPERVTTLEIGSKADLLDERLRVNFALFRSSFDDIQLAQRLEIPGLGVTRVTQNAGTARIDGGELELAAALPALRLTGSVGVVDARYTAIEPGVTGVTLDSRFAYTPKVTYSLATDVPVTTGAGPCNLHADYSWRDDVYFGGRPLASQPSYGLLNAMVSCAFAPTPLELSLWGRNLTDEHYVRRAIDRVTFVNAMPGDPRTVGATLTYSFGAADASPQELDDPQRRPVGNPRQ